MTSLICEKTLPDGQRITVTLDTSDPTFLEFVERAVKSRSGKATCVGGAMVARRLPALKPKSRLAQ
jgi:hypothetical protein